jgi:hypothetical protein
MLCAEAVPKERTIVQFLVGQGASIVERTPAFQLDGKRMRATYLTLARKSQVMSAFGKFAECFGDEARWQVREAAPKWLWRSIDLKAKK